MPRSLKSVKVEASTLSNHVLIRNPHSNLADACLFVSTNEIDALIKALKTEKTKALNLPAIEL